MKHFFASTTLVTGLALLPSFASTPASAYTLFQATLDSAQEVAPGGVTQSPATGSASLKLNDAATELSYSINVVGVDFSELADVPSPANALDVATMLHFHQAPRGENGPVVFGIFAPDQDNDDRTVTFNSDGSTTISGIWDLDDPASTSLSEIAPGLLATAPGADTDLYLNLHSENDPGGIIRGQIIATPVSEPFSVLGLLAVGVIGAGSAIKRKLVS